MDKFLLTLAYKHVAMAIMLAQANEFAQKTHLPFDHRLTMSDINRGSHVSPPRLMGFGGSIVTSGYFFGFNHGYLANFKKLEPKLTSDQAYQLQNEQLGRKKSLLDLDGAYGFATNELAGLQIDVAALESNYHRTVTQRFYYKNPELSPQARTNRDNLVWLPVFEIAWNLMEVPSPTTSPLLTLTVLASSSELVEFHITDDAIVGGPRLPIKDAEALLRISDEVFQKFDETQRSNLIVQSSQSLSQSSSKIGASEKTDAQPRWQPALK